VVSEEDGGLGALATLQRGHRGEAAIISEPTSGGLVTANAGALTFELRVAGRAAHGSTRLEGVSALDAFLPLHEAIRALERRRNADAHPLFAGNPLPYPISIGRIRAGDWPSSVPDVLVAEGRVGVRLGEDPADARRAFEEALAEACSNDGWLTEHPADVSWPGGQFASGQLSEGHQLIDEVADAAALVTGTRPVARAAPYGSDLRLYEGIGGIPTLHYGPGDVRFAHAPREQVGISETLRIARVLAVLAARRCGARLAGR
jgi:acetylornithine deacetylase